MSLSKVWIIFKVALCFGVFALGCLSFLPLTPILVIVIPAPTLRHRLSRRLVYHWFRLFVSLMRAFGVVFFSIDQEKALQKGGQIIVANHPSLVDVVCLISCVPNATTVVKSSLAKNPFTCWPILAAGYIPNDTGKSLIKRAQKELDQGATLIIFPEGTRTPVNLAQGEVPRLHRGAMAIALSSQRALTPVRFTPSCRYLAKHTPWWNAPTNGMRLEAKVLDNLEVQPWLSLYNQSQSSATREVSSRLSDLLFTNH